MATSSVIWFIICVLVVCHAQITDVRRLNIKINRLSKKTENLENDVDDIWATILTPGKEMQDHVNKTRTDNSDTKAQDVATIMSGTVTDVQELKTVVEQQVLSSRIGFKNEKSWQREAIRNITRNYTEFQSGVVEENIELKNHLQELDTKVTKIEKINNDNRVSIETINHELYRRMSETEKDSAVAQGVVNEHLSKILVDINMLSVKQSRLETENRELNQKISEMENEYRAKQSRMETENQELKQAIRKVQKDNEDMKKELTKSGATALLKPCDEGWESFQHHCYLFVNQYKTWDEAFAFCESKNSYLVELTTDAEFGFASELLGGHRRRGWGWCWIGATDRETEGTFVYQHSKLQVPEKYWSEGEPDNEYEEQCVIISHFPRRNGVYKLLYDLSCRLTLRFVCEKS